MDKLQTMDNERQMGKMGSGRPFNLEERTLLFGKELIGELRRLPKNTINFALIDQVVRSGTSIGANYREANEALGKKDFAYRIRIARKEAKETSYWLELLIEANPEHETRLRMLLDETKQLRSILSAILEKTVKEAPPK